MLMTHKHADPVAHFSRFSPSEPVLYFSESTLQSRLDTFQTGLKGTLCYAVKCNAHPTILQAMIDAGLDEFDVASPQEIALIRGLSPAVRMNYNNPIRSISEIQFALENGVRSFSVDCIEELEKLAKYAPKGTEATVRLKLDLDGSAYHFGEKFGETPEGVADLMHRAAELGFIVSGTFHVGTQCERPENWREYLRVLADCARQTSVTLARVNVGGGFPSARNGETPDYARYFAAITDGLAGFDGAPKVLAEPGRALIADACQYVVQIKSMRQGRWVFLNDGVYGGLSEMKLMGSTPYRFYAPNGTPRKGAASPYTIYGPTCDSIDGFDEKFFIPDDAKEGDYMLFDGAGAYVLGLNTHFNGYGEITMLNVENLVTSACTF